MVLFFATSGLRFPPHRNRLRNVTAAVQRHLTARLLHRIHRDLLPAPHLAVCVIALAVSDRLVSLCIVPLRIVRLLVRCLGNIAGARDLAGLIRITLLNIALPCTLRITVQLGVTCLRGITLLPLGIIRLPLRIVLLGVGILVGSLIGNRGRLGPGIPRLLNPSLAPDGRLAARNLRRLINALRRLVTRLLLSLICLLLRRITLLLLRRVSLERSTGGITSGRIPLLRTVALALNIIIFVLVHLLFPFRRTLPFRNPLA